MSETLLREYINMIESQDTIGQVKLPVELDSVGRVLSKENVDYHYNVLHKNYVKKAHAGNHSEFMLGGVELHNLFFEQFQSIARFPTGASLELIVSKFDNLDNFKSEFGKVALSIQGAGWCYLSTTGNIEVIANHALANDVAVIIDMWEHSYYLDYGPNKDKYLDNMWNIINWDVVNERLN